MGDAITGEAKDVGEVIGGWAFSVALSDSVDIKKPLLITMPSGYYFIIYCYCLDLDCTPCLLSLLR